MRIISGIFGGRRLPASVAGATRPTADRVREGLFSALEARGCVAGAHVLDLFAGTGALGLEALSRGASRVLAVDHDKRALECIAANVRALDVADRVQALKLDLLKNPATSAQRLCAAAADMSAFTLILADPPYAELARLWPLLDMLLGSDRVAQETLIVVEHAGDASLDHSSQLQPAGNYRYGDSAITLLARAG